MVNLLNPALRSRDIRKLVETHLHEVFWDTGVDESSEWVIASLEDDEHIHKLEKWLESKGITAATEILLTNSAWSEIKQITWGSFLEHLSDFFNQEQRLIVAADRTWVMEYAPQEIVRFGRWVNVT